MILTVHGEQVGCMTDWIKTNILIEKKRNILSLK